MKKIALLFSTLIVLLVASCSSTTSLSDSNHPITPLANANTGSYCYLRGDILQAFNSKEALGKDNDIVVKLVTNEDTFYDGKEFSGIYIMTGTYTYESKGNGIKTVPIFIKASEYEKNIP